MSIRVSEDIGAAQLNNAIKICRVESQGPATIVVKNLSDVGNVVIGLQKETAGTLVASDRDTAVTAENTGYTGNTSTWVFSAQALDHVPVIPGTVVLTPATSGSALYDGGDGVLYNDDDVASGSIDYFTGAMVLGYPVGDAAPDGQINAAYSYQDELLVHGGQRTYSISSFDPDDAVEVWAACDYAAGASLKVEVAATWG